MSDLFKTLGEALRPEPNTETLKIIFRVIVKSHNECNYENYEKILKNHLASDNFSELRISLEALKYCVGNNRNETLTEKYFILFLEKAQKIVGGKLN